MSLMFTEKSVYGWNGFSISNGTIELGIIPEIGGRIVSMKFKGEELLFVQQEHMGETFDFSNIEDIDSKKEELGFRLWGGDKTWIAPQKEWSKDMPPLLLDAGKYSYKISGQKIIMQSPNCKETGLSVTREIEFDNSGEIVLTQTIKNVSDKPVTKGIWDVTQCLRPFDTYFAAPIDSVKAYANEGESVAIKDELLYQTKNWTVLPCRKAAHFKFGAVVNKGVFVALRKIDDVTLAWVRNFDIDPSAKYAHESIVEVYNSPDMNYLEMEIHAPLKTLAPDESQTHKQTWNIGLVKPEMTVDEIVKKLS